MIDEDGCKEEVEACDECHTPPLYICDNTDELNPQCKECEGDLTGCLLDVNEACSSCDPPTVYKCDKTDEMNPICM